MRLGLLADIHEDIDRLNRAVARLDALGAERYVMLGDVFEVGDPARLDAVAGVLERISAVGVWGNHDFGLCVNPDDHARQRYTERTIRLMTSLRPRLVVDDCHFSHVEPWLDTDTLEGLWWFEGFPTTPERLAPSFDAVRQRLMLVGHFHRWLVGTRDGLLDWRGEGPLQLDPDERHLIVVHAVYDGWAALLDTTASVLTPVPLDTPGLGFEPA